jgi:hypothetical protein
MKFLIFSESGLNMVHTMPLVSFFSQKEDKWGGKKFLSDREQIPYTLGKKAYYNKNC